MKALLYLLPALGCGLMMVACMYLMGRGMRSHHRNPPVEADTNRQVAELREEVARLRAEREGGMARG